MTNYERLVSETSLNRMVEALQKDDFCCETHIEKGGFECIADNLNCADCLKEWLMKESK